MLVSLCPFLTLTSEFVCLALSLRGNGASSHFCPLTIPTPTKSWYVVCLPHWSPVALRTAYRCLLDIYELGHHNVRTYHLPTVMVIVFFFEMNHHTSLSSPLCLLYLYFCHSFTFQTTVIQLRMKHWFLHYGVLVHAHTFMKKNYIHMLVLFPPDLLCN